MEISTETLLANLGIKELSEMQHAAMEQSADKDLILLSPTGSGKTLAYFLNITKNLSKGKCALIIAPSRELSIQIAELFKQAKCGLTSICCYGGHSASDERKQLIEHPDIIIGTPGRIVDHIEKGSIATDDIEIWAVDEFDKALELGFQEQIEQIHRQLRKLKKRLLVSATYSDYFMEYIQLNPYDKLDYSNQVKPDIKIYEVKSEETDKINTLIKLLHDIGARQNIVFCNYRESVDRISQLLRKAGINHVSYHGGMEQMDREKALSRFKSKSTYTLVTTDLASRGLDIADIDSVIHYHLPPNIETFVHRNGRSARWQAQGRSFLIINDKEQIPEWLDTEVETYIIENPNRKIPQPQFSTLYIGKGKKDKLSKTDIMGFLCKKGALNKEDVGVIIIKEKFSFVAVKTTKVKQTIKMIANEKIKGMKTIIEIANS